MANELNQLETIASELMTAFDIVTTPVPIETMLQQPKEGMWQEVDINQLSGSFLSIREHYSPRMSLARLLARHVASSPWGRTHGLMNIIKDEELLRAFARMLIMPKELVLALSSGARNPTAMSIHFEAPEEDARLRLQDLAESL
jgi:hypothetical protein